MIIHHILYRYMEEMRVSECSKTNLPIIIESLTNQFISLLNWVKSCTCRTFKINKHNYSIYIQQTNQIIISHIAHQVFRILEKLGKEKLGQNVIFDIRTFERRYSLVFVFICSRSQTTWYSKCYLQPNNFVFYKLC